MANVSTIVNEEFDKGIASLSKKQYHKLEEDAKLVIEESSFCKITFGNANPNMDRVKRYVYRTEYVEKISLNDIL